MNGRVLDFGQDVGWSRKKSEFLPELDSIGVRFGLF